MNVSEIINAADVAIKAAKNSQELEVIHAQYLGRKGQLTELLKTIGELSSEERPLRGQAVNRAKERIRSLLNQRDDEFKKRELDKKLSIESIDVTLPGRGCRKGSLHPIKQIMDRAIEILSSMGFIAEKGPEIETSYYNFEALNIPLHHPCRSPTDTFYFADGSALRSQTSTVQIRYMERHQPPIRIVAPGKVFRRDFDSTHSPMFHQLELLLVDEQVTLSDLKGLTLEFFRQFFNDDTAKVRFRPSYFPFVKPGAEVDVQFTGKNKWLEIGGLGMVHPNVFKYVNINPEKYTGYAFGLGVDRLTMLYHGIDDIRMFFENDLRLLEQF
jgi:phenylalanyl-tRNA synthetase alpha chain